MREHPSTALILELRRLLPDRSLAYDAELIWNDRDYAALLQRYAAITGCEWQPARVRSWLSRDGTRA